MAKTNDTQRTLFQRLALIRSSVEKSRKDTESLRRSIDRSGGIAADGGLPPGTDLFIQLRTAAKLLDEAAVQS
jgi:hypothetical protein